MDPWRLELITVRDGSHGGGERRSLTRDVERGLLVRVRQGAYVERGTWDELNAEGRHIIAMRAFTALSDRAPVFSHWSAAMLHGLPFVGRHLDRVHVTVPLAKSRGREGTVGHVFDLRPEEVVRFGGLLATGTARTVVDVAGASPFADGVVVADGALFLGLPRELLEQAVDLAGERRSGARIADVTSFAHPGAESAAESESRVTEYRLGVEPPELQHEVTDRYGSAGRVDSWWQRQRAIGEVDGAKKYLDPKLATQGAGRVVYNEKRREDRLRAESDGLARWGWVEACSTTLLRPILARLGVRPVTPRPTLEDWASLARAARTSRRTGRLVVPR